MADVFISYARHDKATASSLDKRLSDQGFSVWWDADLVASENFNDVIRREILEAGAVVVIWSDNSVRSLFVIDEARFALHLEKLVSS